MNSNIRIRKRKKGPESLPVIYRTEPDTGGAPCVICGKPSAWRVIRLATHDHPEKQETAICDTHGQEVIADYLTTI